MTTVKSSTRHRSSGTLTRSPMVPHLAFWGVCLASKLIFPGSLKWVAYDTISTLLVSVWYPLCATISLIHREKVQQKHEGDKSGSTDPLATERQFWIQYWSVGFAGVQFIHQFISAVPSLRQMGRHDHPQLPVILKEIKLLFFVWLFVMESLLVRHQRFVGVNVCEDNWKRYVPLTFLTKAVGPRLMQIQVAISEQISKDTWKRLIQRKAQRVLEVFVVLQFLEEESMTYLLELLEEGRSLLLLSVFVVLPSSISQVGVLYAQYIFPSARSLVARGDAMETLSLKYWVLNSILSLFFNFTWWLWWCIPFSSQLLIAVRCFFTFPSTITHYYSMVEMELITFGLLSGDPKLTVKETKTVKALRAVVKRLPRDKQAQSFQFEIDELSSEVKSSDDDSSVGSVDTTESEEERRKKKRREKRAQRKLTKQTKVLGTTNSSSARPPPLLSDSFVIRYDEDEQQDHGAESNNDALASDEGEYSSFINSKDDGNDPKLYQYSLCSADKEERDATNAAIDSASQGDIRHPISISIATSDGSENNHAWKLPNLNTKDEETDMSILPSMTIGSNYSSSQLQIDSKLTNLSIATPTENVVDEVEVQMKRKTRQSKSSQSKMPPTSIFPATYPKSFGNNLTMTSASHEEDKNHNKSTDSGLDLSDIDTTASSTIDVNESFESRSPLHEEHNAGKNLNVGKNNGTAASTTTTTGSEISRKKVSTPPRRSSRLCQLRDWQEQKRREEEEKVANDRNTAATKSFMKSTKSTTSKAKASTVRKPFEKPAPERPQVKKLSTADKNVRKSETDFLEKVKKSTKKSVEKGEKKSMIASPKRTSKNSMKPTPEKPTPEQGSVTIKPITASIGKRVNKSSMAASPKKITKNNKEKGDAPTQDNKEDEIIRSPSSSPRKSSRNKPRKVPNSKKKKKTMFGSALSRK